MKMKAIPFPGYLSVVFLILFISCTEQQKNYKKTENGVVVDLGPDKDGARLVRLQVVNDQIIHVSATPDPTFKDPSSLVLKEGLAYATDWEMKEGSGHLTLHTNKLEATVSLTTGQVIFKDTSGNTLLREVSEDGRGFKPVEVEDEKSFAIKQLFETNEGEAFYGLGQHQAGLFNYQNKHVDLTQYNGVAVVPFAVSSKPYGLLWDNYSITKFGDTRPVKPLSGLKLFAEKDQASPVGLKAIYASDRKKPTEGLEKLEKEIDYTFIPCLDKMPDFNMAKGSVTWTGFMQPEMAGEHTFKMSYSGYIKIWLDGEEKINTWRESWNPGFEEFTHELQESGMHKVKIEWVPESDQSFLSLNFLGPQTEEDAASFGFSSESGDQLDYFFVQGETMDEVISGYRALTGKAQVMPKWAMGFWQSRERYKTQDELLETLKTFRNKGIPLDNIVQDWSYWPEDAWGSHDFDKDRFPDPEGMVEAVHAQNAHIMISVWPKYYEGIDNYNTMNEKGMLYTQNIKNQQRDWIGEGYVSTFYDAYNEEARRCFWGQLNESLFSKGMDAWWLDATEPDIYSNASIAQRKQLMHPTALGSGQKYFNAYSLANAKGIYEGQRGTSPDQRVFILTRSAFAGIQRYGAATWSGDIASRFDELERQIPAGLNFALSGLPYWTTDIGGFFVEDKYDRPRPQGEDLEEWRELNARWYQFGTFCPLFRAHGQFPYREIFNIAPEGHPAYQSMLYYNKLRYRLMPYIYSLTGKVYHEDYTIMRALVMDFPQDEKVKDIGNQFMFGPALLVNPVTTYKARTKQLYLPEGTDWYDLYDGKHISGGQTVETNAPYERMPIYVRAGSIIPYGPEVQYASEKTQDEITLYVYAGADGKFDLYDDEHTNYNYEKDQYTLVPIRYNNSTKELEFGDRQGDGFEGSPSKVTFHIKYITKDQPVPLDFDAAAEKSVVYEGGATKINL